MDRQALRERLNGLHYLIIIVTRKKPGKNIENIDRPIR